MIIKYFSVFDSATLAFLPPFAAPAAGAAIRSFQDAINDEKHEMSRHFLDYTLFELGSFDDSSGAFTSLDLPSKLCSGADVALKNVTPKTAS